MIESPAFQFTKLQGGIPLVGHDLFNDLGKPEFRCADLLRPRGFHEALVSENDGDFLAFNDQVRCDLPKEGVSFLAGNVPAEQGSMVFLGAVGSEMVKTSSESGLEFHQWARIAHVDTGENLVSRLPVGVSFIGVGGESDIAFAIKQSSSVLDEIASHLSAIEKGCEVGGHPDRTIPSQAEAKASGVCREHGQPPKGMMCSELGRNVERSAEMTGPDMYMSLGEYTCLVTDCNTDYIFLRYATRRLFKPLERMQSINQDAIVQLITFAGNMTSSNCDLQGVLKA